MRLALYDKLGLVSAAPPASPSPDGPESPFFNFLFIFILTIKVIKIKIKQKIFYKHAKFEGFKKGSYSYYLLKTLAKASW
jgi:hypothetical protein